LHTIHLSRRNAATRTRRLNTFLRRRLIPGLYESSALDFQEDGAKVIKVLGLASPSFHRLAPCCSDTANGLAILVAVQLRDGIAKHQFHALEIKQRVETSLGATFEVDEALFAYSRPK
jgi:hypothetical protein